MFLEYMKTLMYKINKYDKNATNPFINYKNYDNNKTMYEQTYIWVEKLKDE